MKHPYSRAMEVSVKIHSIKKIQIAALDWEKSICIRGLFTPTAARELAALLVAAADESEGRG